MTDLAPPLPSGHRLGRYVVNRALGRGGMGVVYAARDERLGREVALKMIAGPSDEVARARFWREARAAASVSHPHVCQIFEVDETPDGILIAMELLEGEPLDARLRAGPLAPAEAARTAIAVLAALGALHARGLVHRDVKPGNVYLTPHGPKLLDFGLARPTVDRAAALDAITGPPLTHPGLMVGTPHYMAPEELRGHDVDGRADLYAVGALLFQMLTGRTPFEGATVVEVLVATLHERPPALQGPPAVVAMDRVIRRALQKEPSARFETAEAMAAALSTVEVHDSSSVAAVPIRALIRVIVPPIRLARASPELAYLSFGLAEAVSGSLASLTDLVVRAPVIARSWSMGDADPRRLATEADVDFVIAGALVHADAEIRVTIQLIEASSGTLLGSTSVTGRLDDIFAFEDAFVKAAVALLAPHRPAASAAHPASTDISRRDTPASARAFELFLRGIEHARQLDGTPEALVLFEQAVQEDPGFAPAWAALGRCHRVYGKFFADRDVSVARAEEALHRALALSPDLPAAHRYLTHLESEHGRAPLAIGRLLEHATVNRNDAHLFAGLVHACRYAGLIDQSLAAHAEASRLDPTVETSVDYTYMHVAEHDADVERLSQTLRRSTGPDGMLAVMAFSGSAIRFRAAIDRLDPARVPPHYGLTLDAISAAVLAPGPAGIVAVQRAIAAHTDPEAQYLSALCLFKLDAPDAALDLLEKTVHSGFIPARMLRRHSLFDAVRHQPRFEALVTYAEQKAGDALAIFTRGGGPQLVGVEAVR